MAARKEGSKIAETARLERAQGGQPQAHDSGDPNVTVRSGESQHAQSNDTSGGGAGGAAGPHNKPGKINKHSTPGTGMLSEPGKASDDDMAPSG